ncbi:hypothetical protein OSB04_004059 [Centaurea solstitialis]|uniref:Damage-control phosphatase ARMT1-like metal-binding domain-containing protein n=1 Tax=Centaurea solstitialis TaxID=347529 RepID=A0AA38TW31_9ASTR|nr:hypothetical protein OSB04_004059 [Centaurea solstitialis]
MGYNLEEETKRKVDKMVLIDLSGAAIQGNLKKEIQQFCCLISLMISHIWHWILESNEFLYSGESQAKNEKLRNTLMTVHMYGSLIKLVYFSRHEDSSCNDKRKKSADKRFGVINGHRTFPVAFGSQNGIRWNWNSLRNLTLKELEFDHTFWSCLVGRNWNWNKNVKSNATGGGAYKFADLFKERLGVSIEKEDEMHCLVAGANFLLKVDGDGKFERVSGTNVGGGTYWGLGKLLTKCKSFDELLEVSQRGDNRAVDMLVGDIYGGLDYSKIGLSASTIASSFGKTISENKEIEDYSPEDISLSLLRMISYNIGQISYLTALQLGINRIFFGGFFIRGHAYTMDTISFAIQFWSKGGAQAMFLRHEGFLGALGAFMSYEKHGLDDLMAHQLVERFPMGAPYTGGKIHGPALGNLNEKASLFISWMEKFVQKGTQITDPVPMAAPRTTGLGGFEAPSSKGDTLRSDESNLNVGVLHLVPSLEVFPLLANPKSVVKFLLKTVQIPMQPKLLEGWVPVRSGYQPLDEKWMHIRIRCTEMYRINSLLKRNSWEGMRLKVINGFRSTSHVKLNFPHDSSPTFGCKDCLKDINALGSFSSFQDKKVKVATSICLTLMLLCCLVFSYEPNTIDLADPNELEYWFTVLSEHLPDLVDTAVASEGGTDDARRRGEAFARAFSAHLARLMEEPAAYGKLGLANLLELREECLREFNFSDAYSTIKQRENEASLAVLPDLLMELDSMSEETRLLTLIEGVLAANIFDWGSRACVDLYHKGTIIEIYRMSRKKMQRPWRVDDFDAFKERMGFGGQKPCHKRALLFVDNSGADIILGMLPLAREFLRRGTEVVLVANSLPALNDVTAVELPEIVAEASKGGKGEKGKETAEAGGLLVDAMISIQEGSKQKPSSTRLMVVENGCGGPCIDLRQVSSELAAAAKDADLVVLEGMGRALHTNYNARFKCDTLKIRAFEIENLSLKL